MKRMMELKQGSRILKEYISEAEEIAAGLTGDWDKTMNNLFIKGLNNKVTRKILYGQVQQAKVASTKVPLKNVIAATRACLHED